MDSVRQKPLAVFPPSAVLGSVYTTQDPSGFFPLLHIEHGSYVGENVNLPSFGIVHSF